MTSNIVDSSLWDLDDMVIKVFFTLLAEKGPGDIYTKTNYALARASRKSEPEVEKALEILSGPDKLRPGQYKQGARIEAVEGGWHIINAAFYRQQMSEELRRYRNAKAQKAWRERQATVKKKPSRGRGKPLPGEKAFAEAQANGELRKAEGILDQHLPAESKVSQFPDGPDIEHEPVPGHVTKVEDWGNAKPVPPAAPVQRDPWESRSEESFPEV